MKSIVSIILKLMLLSFILTGCSLNEVVDLSLENTTKSDTTVPSKNNEENYDVTLSFPSEKYPETANHIINAIESGESSVCTIDRDGADENRDKSLDGIPTKEGYDRDEFPMAMCEEGGEGADIEYISPSDNRGAGSWVSHQLSDYPDGTRVKFIVE